MKANVTRVMEYRSPATLKPARRNARTHSAKQIKQIAASIQAFGFTNPVLVDDEDRIIAGHGRVAAAQQLGLATVPVVHIGDLSANERKAYALADNKLALNAGWDPEVLALELQELIDLEFDLDLTGFGIAEIDFALDAAKASDPTGSDAATDRVPAPADHAVSRFGDHWQLGRHTLLCGDAREAGHYVTLLEGRAVQLVFTDPPYNVPIDGHVSGLGKRRHREFVMGVGEMAADEFVRFLGSCLSNMASSCTDGAILFVCMDWRHMRELLTAGHTAQLELKNLCVWNKTNGGMGTFYRSKHELVFVFKHGESAHVNSFGLGDTGRYRTNVWDYPGISSMGAKRASEQAMHPTVKPVALIADAIRDCSRRGDMVLDPFGGSGSTLIAAEVTGRVARLIEFDPLYCDTIIRRYEAFSGKQASLVNDTGTYAQVSERRLSIMEAVR